MFIWTIVLDTPVPGRPHPGDKGAPVTPVLDKPDPPPRAAAAQR
jgi:hypothetical protein